MLSATIIGYTLIFSTYNQYSIIYTHRKNIVYIVSTANYQIQTDTYNQIYICYQLQLLAIHIFSTYNQYSIIYTHRKNIVYIVSTANYQIQTDTYNQIYICYQLQLLAIHIFSTYNQYSIIYTHRKTIEKTLYPQLIIRYRQIHIIRYTYVISYNYWLYINIQYI